MFRIECFVEDAKLVMVLRSLAGLVKAMDVQPVVNVEIEKGEMKAKSNGQSATELFAEYLQSNKDEVTSEYVKQFLHSIGRSPSSYQYVLRKSIEHLLITKQGKGNNTVYKRRTS